MQIFATTLLTGNLSTEDALGTDQTKNLIKYLES